MHGRIAIPPPAERRIRREARSETLRALALSLRRGGWTLAAIAKVLGVSTTRAFQMVRKAERLISKGEAAPEGAAACISRGGLQVQRTRAGYEP